MTDFEKQQPLSQFIETGKKAYRMGIDISRNPYKEQPWRDLWEEGWRIARKAEESQRPEKKRPEKKRPEKKRPPFKQQEDHGYDRKHRHPKPNERRQNAPQQQNPFNTDRLVARFNRRNRTAI